MTAPWMAYAAAVAVLLAGAAWCLERAVLLAGRPARAVWAAALALALAAPAWAALRPAALAPAPVAGAPNDRAHAGDDAWAAWLARVGPAAAAPADAGAAWRAWDLPLGVGWAVAALVLAARRAVAGRRLARQARGWPRRVVDGVAVRVAPDAGPATMGVLRPHVVLPAWMLADPRLALALRHEEEHRRARDPLLLAAAEAAVVAMPWNPGLWWLRAGMRAAVELDCDRRVLDAPGMYAAHSVADYGRLLLDVAGRGAGRPSLAPSLAARPTTALERRIRVMTSRRPARPALQGAALAGLTAALAAAACEVPRPVSPAAAPARLTGGGAPRVRGAQPNAAEVRALLAEYAPEVTTTRAGRLRLVYVNDTVGGGVEVGAAVRGQTLRFRTPFRMGGDARVFTLHFAPGEVGPDSVNVMWARRTRGEAERWARSGEMQAAVETVTTRAPDATARPAAPAPGSVGPFEAQVRMPRVASAGQAYAEGYAAGVASARARGDTGRVRPGETVQVEISGPDSLRVQRMTWRDGRVRVDTLRPTPRSAGSPVDSALVVLDGRELGRGMAAVAAKIHSDSIAGVDVVKGPAAEKLYGEKARNGVIIITTKAAKP